MNFSGAVEMQLYRLPTGRHRRIVLHAFYDLMDKSEGLTLPSPGENQKEWMNDKEMFLYKFLYVTAKARLYEIHHEETTGSSSRNTPLSRWYLRECESTTRGDLNDVRAILFDAGETLNPLTNLSLREAVLSLRPKKEPPRPSLVSKQQSTTTKPAETALFPQLSTVEERIRAKRKARLLQEEEHEAKETTTTNSRDATWRLRVADILWTHSRKVWHRHEQFASPKRKGKTSPCAFVLVDLVSILTEQSTAVMGNKMTRRQVVSLLQEICREVPEWIRRSSAKEDGSSEWGKSDTLWVQPLDYQVVRQRLLGKSTVVAAQLAPSKILGTATNFGFKKSPPVFADKKEGIAKVTEESEISKKRLRKFEYWDVSASTLLKDKQSPPHTKKVRTDDIQSPRQQSPVTKKRRLRVNPHLILTDADHQGGERIFPSRNDSPRGLKNLFHQMNSGKRI